MHQPPGRQLLPLPLSLLLPPLLLAVLLDSGWWWWCSGLRTFSSGDGLDLLELFKELPDRRHTFRIKLVDVVDVHRRAHTAWKSRAR